MGTAAFKGKSQKKIDKMLSFDGIFKDRRERQYKWVSATGWRGLEWEIGDKGYFHFMKKNNDDFLHLVFNPPYGERLRIDIESFYKKIGDKLKTDYSNSNAWFITSSVEALKYVGLRPSRKIKLFNGKLESRLAKYEIYSGSKKAKKNIY